MVVRRPVRAALILVLSLIVTAATVIAADKDKDKDKDKKKDVKLSSAQQKELEQLVQLADGIEAGQALPPGIHVSLATDFFKMMEGKTFVAYTVPLTPGELSFAPAGDQMVARVDVYLRVTAKGTPAPSAPAPAAAKSDKDNDKDKKGKNGRPEYAYEDFFETEIKVPAAQFATLSKQPYRLSRSFGVAGGAHDVVITVKQPGAPNAGGLKQDVDVPNLWSADLNTSSLLLLQEQKQLQSTLTAEQQREQPYTFGLSQLVPRSSSELKRSEELGVFFFIYNEQNDAATGKPNVTIDYSFYQQLEGGEKYFNKTAPLEFNAQTLPPQFDAATYQLPGGQGIPLASFPEGKYRLEIKITDNVAKKSVTRQVLFSVKAAA